MEQLLSKAIYTLLELLIFIIVGYIVELIRKKIGVENMQKISEELSLKQDLAIIAVKYAEQAWYSLKGPEKYNKAAEYLSNEASKLGLSVTPDEIKGLIEWALRSIKDQFGEDWANIIKEGEEKTVEG